MMKTNTKTMSPLAAAIAEKLAEQRHRQALAQDAALSALDAAAQLATFCAELKKLHREATDLRQKIEKVYTVANALRGAVTQVEHRGHHRQGAASSRGASASIPLSTTLRKN